MATSKVLTKAEKTKKEFLRLSKIFRDIPKDRKDTVVSLLQNAAFMTVQLEELQNTINEKGVISEYQNGENQWGTKKSPEVEIYNTMVKNHSSIIRQLTDILPDEKSVDASEEILKFAFGGKK
ncbi:MAG: hypothetical protein NWF06_01845 [Candidatus Bathyarchaeota archaeon]|nr:hypothetical protein [Candidatus Bathyarchaeum sp.]